MVSVLSVYSDLALIYFSISFTHQVNWFGDIAAIHDKNSNKDFSNGFAN